MGLDQPGASTWGPTAVRGTEDDRFSLDADARDRQHLLRLFAMGTAGLALVFALATGALGADYVAGGLAVFAALSLALSSRAGVLTPAVGGGLFTALWILALAAAVPWTGGGTSPALPLLIPAPVAATFLAGKRGGVLAVLGISILMLGGLALTVAGSLPPSVLGPEAARGLLLATLLTTVSITTGFGILYDRTWQRQTAQERARSQALREVTRTMTQAAEGLRRAADAFRGQAGPDTLVEAMDRAAESGRESAERARGRVRGFLERQGVLLANAEAIEAYRKAVEELMGDVRRVSERLDLVALDVSILAAGEGEAGVAFGALAGRTRGLVERLGSVAETTSRTLAEIAAAQALSSEEAAGAQDTARAAATALERLAASFETVCSLVDQASLMGRELAQAALEHVSELVDKVGASQGVEDQETLRQEIIRGLLPWLVAGAAGPVVLMGFALTVALGASPGPLLLVLGGLTASPLLGLRRGLSLRTNSQIFILASNVLLGTVSWAVGGGLTAPAIGGLAITPLAAIFLLDRRAGLRWAAVALSMVAAMGAADLASVTPPSVLSGRTLDVLRFVPTVIFSGLAFGFGVGFTSVLGSVLARVSAERQRLHAVLRELGEAGQGVADLAESIAGTGQGARTLAEDMREEAARGTRLSDETRAHFAALVARNEQVARSAQGVAARAERVADLVGDVKALSFDLDLTASRVAMTAVQATHDASAFEVLGGEMADLTVTLQRDTDQVRAALMTLGEAVEAAREDARASLEDTQRGAGEVEELARSFDDVCALIERAADASHALATEVQAQFEVLQAGLESDLAEHVEFLQ